MIVFAVVGLIALFFYGCQAAGGTWRANLERGLAATAVVSTATVKAVRGDKLCRPVVEQCKAEQAGRDCPALQKCHRAQILILGGLGVVRDGLKSIQNGLRLLDQGRGPDGP
jgi:hypothetical protein